MKIKLTPVDYVEKPQGTFPLYDCHTGAHRWPCSDMAQLCCNGFTARYFPIKDIPSDAIIFQEKELGLIPITFVKDLSGKLQACTSGLLPDQSPNSSRYNTIESRLEPTFIKDPALSALNFKMNLGYDYQIPALLQDFLVSGIIGSPQFADHVKISNSVNALLAYILLLWERKCVSYWEDERYINEFCKQNDWDERQIALLNEIIAHYKKWKIAFDSLNLKSDKDKTN